jgi:hypothetical protein
MLYPMVLVTAIYGQVPEMPGSAAELPLLTPGRTAALNSLWFEDDPHTRFDYTKRVVMAEIKGPATITMIHFALPMTVKHNRDVLLKIYWDGEKEPSVDCPLVDFFCDAAGVQDSVNTAFVNKRQGWNAYFPMPFRNSARIELVYDGPLEPGQGRIDKVQDPLWRQMPAYGYVMYRTLDRVPEQAGYFHSHWRQDTLLLGRREYVALEAKGNGKFVGWNLTVRPLNGNEYPVDENAKFFIDGERSPSVELQGLEDAFGFSWGFPPSSSQFPLTGYLPFFNGAAAYRFFVQDAIHFEKSLRVTIGFGKHEDPGFYTQFSKPGTEVQFSSTVYWYQTEPHAALPALPSAEERALPRKGEKLPTPESLKQRGVKLLMLCGRPYREVFHAESGYAAVVKEGNSWDAWVMPVYHCRESSKAVEIEVTTPKGVSGTLRLYVLDSDNFVVGRKQTVTVAGKSLGTIEGFQKGRWLEQPLTATDTESGKILIRAENTRQGATNAVISMVEWIEKNGG